MDDDGIYLVYLNKYIYICIKLYIYMIIHGYSKMGVPTIDLPHKIVLFGGWLAIDGNTHMCHGQNSP
jgi:hypothetical protein